MQAEKLTYIKKELQTLKAEQLTEICLRLARYKKENKELVSYLLFEAHNTSVYSDKIKTAFTEDFKLLGKNSSQNVKVAKRILRAINKHAKYTGSKEVEAELLLWFLENLLRNINLNATYKILQNILIRQLIKINSLIHKLHEDLQFDYRRDFEKLIEQIETGWRYFNKRDIGL